MTEDADTDPLHPDGKCRCTGEGTCEWCRTHDPATGERVSAADNEARLKAFEAAELYGDEDDESFHCTEPEDHLDELFRNTLFEEGQSLEECIRAHAPVRVVAFDPAQVSDEAYSNLTECLFGTLIERFGERYGNNDTDPADDLSAEDTKSIMESMSAAVHNAIERLHVYTCNRVAHRDYSEEELLALLVSGKGQA